MGLTVENAGRCSHSSMTDVCILLRRYGDILDARRKQFITDSCLCCSSCDWEGVGLRRMTFLLCACFVAVLSHVMNFYHPWRKINRVFGDCLNFFRRWRDVGWFFFFLFRCRNKLMNFLSWSTLWWILKQQLYMMFFLFNTLAIAVSWQL